MDTRQLRSEANVDLRQLLKAGFIQDEDGLTVDGQDFLLGELPERAGNRLGRGDHLGGQFDDRIFGAADGCGAVLT